MTFAVLHAGEPALPMTPETAGLVLGIGLTVVLLVTYDYYRAHVGGV